MLTWFDRVILRHSIFVVCQFVAWRRWGDTWARTGDDIRAFRKAMKEDEDEDLDTNS
jgi:hypothetical protein